MTPIDLLGTWDLRRAVQDHRAGTSGTVTGSSALTATGPDEVRWDESGTMRLGDLVTPVSRTLLVRRVGEGWTVHFADGRVFHDWVWGSSVEHACAPDDYTGTLAGDARRWTVEWRAVGPAKDYRLSSVLTPAAVGAAGLAAGVAPDVAAD